MDIYKIILNDPIYTTIAIILTVVVFISIFKKLFKVAIILIGFSVLYVGFLYYTGEKIPETTDDFMKDISKRSEEAIEEVLNKSEEIVKRVDKLIKDKNP